MRRFHAIAALALLQASTAQASFNGPLCRGGSENLICYTLWAALIAPLHLFIRYEPYLGGVILAASLYLQTRRKALTAVTAVWVAFATHYCAVVHMLLAKGPWAYTTYAPAFWLYLFLAGAFTSLACALFAPRQG